MTQETSNVRLRRLDGTTATLPQVQIGSATGLGGQELRELDDDGWWHSFRHSGEVDADGFAVFEEDPTFEKVKNTPPRIVQGTVHDENNAPVVGASIALVTRDETVGQGTTDERGAFSVPISTHRDRIRADYVVTHGAVRYPLVDASVVDETADTKVVELCVRRL